MYSSRHKSLSHNLSSFSFSFWFPLCASPSLMAWRASQSLVTHIDIQFSHSYHVTFLDTSRYLPLHPMHTFRFSGLALAQSQERQSSEPSRTRSLYVNTTRLNPTNTHHLKNVVSPGPDRNSFVRTSRRKKNWKCTLCSSTHQVTPQVGLSSALHSSVATTTTRPPPRPPPDMLAATGSAKRSSALRIQQQLSAALSLHTSACSSRAENWGAAKQALEAKRVDRLSSRIIQASSLGLPNRDKGRNKYDNDHQQSPYTGSHPLAGWKPSPGRSKKRLVGSRNSGRPPLSKQDTATIEDDAAKWIDTEQFLLDPDFATKPVPPTKPGDLVELRRNGIVTAGIVLPQPADTETPDDILVLIASGDVVIYRATDVMIQIPDVVDPDLAARATVLSRDYVATSNSLDVASAHDGAHDQYDAARSDNANPAEGVSVTQEPIDLPRFRARASIAARIRIMERQKEREMQRLLPHFRSLFLVDDPLDIPSGTITTPEVLQELNRRDGTSDSNQVNAPSLLAAHTMLMETPSHFLADALSHRTSRLFTLRSKEDRETLDLVSSWTRQPDHEHISSFCHKARELLDWRHSNPYDPTGPPQQQKGPQNIKWSEPDTKIIDYLKLSLGSRREIQADKHGSGVMQILKRAGAHIKSRPYPNAEAELTLDDARKLLLFPDATASDQALLTDLAADITAGSDLQHALVIRFLTTIGVFAPWQNPIQMDTTFRALVKSSTPTPHDLQQLKDLKFNDQGRKQYDDPVYVIDDAGAFELDDGISVSRGPDPDSYWVHVHIADPTACIHPGDALSVLAQRRHSTIYFPEARWALLPDELVDSGVGLGRGGDEQRALTFSAKVNIRTGSVDDFDVRPSLVRDVRVLTYHDATAMLASGTTASTGDARMLDDLQTLQRIAHALSKARNGIIAWGRHSRPSVSHLPLPTAAADTPTFFSGSPSVEVSSSSEEDRNSSGFLVAEMMILAGRIAGLFGSAHDLPLPFRAQPQPEEDKIARILALVNENREVSYMTLLANDLAIPSSGYSDVPAEHFSLGVHSYVRATSPLRRYPDMLAHWQIRSVLSGTQPFMNRAQMQAELPRLERVDLLTKQLMRNAERFWINRRIAQALREGKTDKHLLGPFDARAILTERRISPSTLQVRLRVQLEELNLPADMVFNATEQTPKKTDVFRVAVQHVIQAGSRSGIVVDRV